MKSKQITIKGKKYSSLTEAASAYGLSIGKVSRRLKSGWSLEQAFNLSLPPERKPTTNRKVTVLGKTFDSIKEAAKHYGISIDKLRGRLAIGWSLEEALELVERSHERKPLSHYREIECAGIKFTSIGKLAEHYGLPYKLVYKRIRLNWSPEQAVGLESQPPRYRNKDGSERFHSWVKPTQLESGQMFPDSAEGKYYLYLVENSINDKVYVGITTNSLATRFLAHKAAAANGEGKERTLYNAMRKYGVENFAIRLLRDDASSIKELLEQEVAAIEEFDSKNNGYNTAYGGSLGTSKPITVDGVKFSSMGQAADFYGIEAYNFNQRISKLGWSPEEAAELVERDRFGRRNITFDISYDGKKYSFSSIANAANHFDLLPSTVRYRLKSGWSLEEALELKTCENGRKTVKRGGYRLGNKHYKTLKAIAEAKNISAQALARYIRETELDVEDSVFILVNNLGKKMQSVMVSNKCDHLEAVSILKKTSTS